MDHLFDATAAFEELEQQHPDEADEFFAAIHRLQDLLATRVCRRAYPQGWLTYGGEGEVVQGGSAPDEAGGEDQGWDEAEEEAGQGDQAGGEDQGGDEAQGA